MRIAVLPFLAALLTAFPAMAELRLLMIEQEGCAYCAEWDQVIAPIYPKTPEGQTAPLERVHIRGPYPSDVEIGPRPVFTPTFILIADGQEVGRIDGYPGEDFFWGLLGRMMEETGQFERKEVE